MRRLAPLLAAVLLAAPLAAQLPLIPQPREVTAGAVVPLPRGLLLPTGADADDRFALADLARELARQGIRTGAGGLPVRLVRGAGAPGSSTAAFFADSTHRAEGYLLEASASGVTITAPTAAGRFYGTRTLLQLLAGRGRSAVLQGASIRDWPAFPHRGLHDDLSRGPVPTLEFQKQQVRAFARLKLNTYSPYFEHTLAYESHPLAAPPGGAMTAAEVKELVAYAAQYHIEVIPEQEAFGHLHHVLKHETYAPLGEVPYGHVLAPGDSGSLQLIRDWFRELDTLFPSPYVHLGADETDDLGQGRSREQVAMRGLGPVYLDFLKGIAAAVGRPGRRFLFWGDVAQKNPELLDSLPRSMVAVAWDYGARADYGHLIAPWRDHGVETWVAPGVSNWNRIYPNYAEALANIHGFARDGERLGATGVLTTTWDDDGEALFSQAWRGVAFGAAASWEPGGGDVEAFRRSYGPAFHGDTTGGVELAEQRLEDAHLLLRRAGVGDAMNYLFWVDPWTRDGRWHAERIRPVARELRLLAEEALIGIARARRGGSREPGALDGMEVGARRLLALGLKFQVQAEVDSGYAAAQDSARAGRPFWWPLIRLSSNNGRVQDVRDAYMIARERYEAAWRAENRPYWIENVLTRYDLVLQRWTRRGDTILQLWTRWDKDVPLPPPDSLDLPPR